MTSLRPLVRTGIMQKPFSQAAENNRGPILEVLRQHLPPRGLLLEIGSGTGQHAVFCAAALPQLIWQTSDLLPCHAGIRRWLEDAGPGNVRPPLHLDVEAEPWPIDRADAVFSANTAHIMPWPAVEALFDGVGRVLCAGGPFLLYGPFRAGGHHNSPGNAAFDRALRQRDPAMGLRDLDDLRLLAQRAGLAPEGEVAMPANNRMLIWRKRRPAAGAAG